MDEIDLKQWCSFHHILGTIMWKLDCLQQEISDNLKVRNSFVINLLTSQHIQQLTAISGTQTVSG